MILEEIFQKFKIPQITDFDITCLDKTNFINEGKSGKIYKCIYNNEQVSVKVIKFLDNIPFVRRQNRTMFYFVR